MDVDGHDGPPPRGWSMKKGHRKRLEAACGRKARKGRAPEVGLGRSVAKRSVNVQSRWHMDEWYKPRTRRNLRQSMLEAVGEAEEMYGLYVMDSDEQYVDYAPYVTFNAFQDGACEAKCTDDVEVASVCTSTTAGSDSPSISAVSSTISAASASALALSLCLSPWKAALLRAELVAQQYAAEHQPSVPTSQSRMKKRTYRGKKQTSEAERFLGELRRTYQVKLPYDVAADGSDATPFERFRWQFLRDYGHDICRPLSHCYLGTGKKWHLRPAPLENGVEEKFFAACRRSKQGELQPAFHGTHESNLSSIFSSGLRIPGTDSGVKVANGSVHGAGIYTAYVTAATLSWSYARGVSKPILVCGVLDSWASGKGQRSKHIFDTGSARVIFQEELVAPLFVASVADEGAEGQPALTGVGVAPPKKTIRPELIVEKRRRGPGPRTRLGSPRRLRSALAFLARRAARRRQA